MNQGMCDNSDTPGLRSCLSLNPVQGLRDEKSMRPQSNITITTILRLSPHMQCCSHIHPSGRSLKPSWLQYEKSKLKLLGSSAGLLGSRIVVDCPLMPMISVDCDESMTSRRVCGIPVT